MSAATIASLRISQENCILEAKVYRRWISKSVPDIKALTYCCILIDKELPSRVPYRDENSKLIYPILTDYLGLVRSISDIIPFGTPTTSEKYLRKVDIEDLDGNIVEFTMWDELAIQFDKIEIKKLTPLIIIVVSSCRVTKYKATPSTHYYINPQTAEAQRVYIVFKEKYNSNPPLQIAKYRCQDPEEEKIRNRQTLHTLLEQNPTTFKGVHFTCEGMITSVQENKDWKYPSCRECSKALTRRNGTYVCEDHGKQDPVTYRYKFKAAVTDGTATAQFTFFTKICYAPSTQRGAGAFIADDVLDIQLAIQTEDALTTSSATLSKETAGKEKHITGTPPHDLIKEVAHTIVSTIPAKKSDTERVKDHNTSTGTTAEPKGSSAKHSLLSELSSSTKKRKED
ncbi:nucleic acid-binding, OB-fold protein [Tanacetum coccineum]